MMITDLWKTVKQTLLFLSIVLIGLVFLLPLIWIILGSFKTRVQNFALPPLVIFAPTFDNYANIFQSQFMNDFRNSVIVAVTSTVLSLILGSMTAYGFSRYKIKAGELTLGWILSLRFFPVVALAIPVYILYRALGLLDTHLGLILVYCIINISFAVWFLKGFFDEIPPSLEEAARLDGYSPLQVFYTISLPLVWPGILTTAIFCLIQSINEFLIALTLTTRVAETAPVGLAKLQTAVGPDWGKMCAAATVLMVPVLVFTILVRNQLIRGMSFGRLK
jgi:multiple sugar transport system permease protein